eukprot:Blabericola_migrator_1__7290@NODE_3709_length_1563_cov_13_443182_g206_i3_p1_GENE_NODE_3709_length_1563_cov_13_443182_g206_i3NODE_3709_length_1563_cov_13_443182_g206_i3_p1_ORF_typecomplete_len460_score70_99_NODE_3709_length_1563_cov_13_443182_g206_i321381
MSGARFLPKFVDANAATPSSILALTVLTLEPTLSIKGGFCFPLPCREKRKHNVDHLRNPLENTFIKAQDVFAGEVSRDDNRGVSRKDKKFGKLCEAQCEEFHDLIKNLEANSNLPPHLYPLVTQCKKDFLKASGWYLVREDDQGNLSRRKNSEVKKSMFIGKTSLPDATLTRLGEYVAAIKGSENIGNNKRVLQVHMSKVGIKKWLNDVGSHARIARALLSIAEGKSDAKLRKVAKQVDAKLGTTYLQLYEDAQQDAELHIDDDGTSEVNRYQDRRSSKSQRSSTPRSQGSDTDGQPIRSSKISTPGSRESDSRRVSSASCQNQPVASSVFGSQEGSRVSGSGSTIETGMSERQLIPGFKKKPMRWLQEEVWLRRTSTPLVCGRWIICAPRCWPLLLMRFQQCPLKDGGDDQAKPNQSSPLDTRFTTVYKHCRSLLYVTLQLRCPIAMLQQLEIRLDTS